MTHWNINAIVSSYAQGNFLMADQSGKTLDWYSSRERALMPLDHRFHYPRSLQRVLNQNRFQVAINRDFAGVVRGCADRESTWISKDLQGLYQTLYQAGWGYSFETWQGDQLTGGVLGIAIGAVFIGESMFFRVPEASKVALVKLVEHLRSQRFCLFDVQINNPHLERFGAYRISDRPYQELLRAAIAQERSFLDLAPQPAGESTPSQVSLEL
jgi:leucyl/phenylalanyl-tRNA---protein transferase